MASIQHFTHLPHKLRETSENREFDCDGCGRIGIGKRYQCKECNFNLHLLCGQCPMDFLSVIHLKHHLHLTLIQRSRPSFLRKPACEACGVGVDGLFYQCKRCDLYIHPMCAQLPRFVHHSTDPNHVLELQQLEPCPCTVCGWQCSRWYYRCGACAVNVHIDCLMKMFVSSGNESVEKRRSMVRLRRLSMMHLWIGCIFFGLVLYLALIVDYNVLFTRNVHVQSGIDSNRTV